MKKGRIIISIILVVLVAGAWFSHLKNSIDNTAEYNKCLHNAEDYASRNLYQKAIKSYDEALAIKDTEEVRQLWINSYDNACADGIIEKASYIKAMKTFCDKYPKRADLWEKLIQLSIDDQKYKDAKLYYNQAVRAGAKSEVLDDLRDIINYSYTINNRIYSQVIPSSLGYYTVKTEKAWGVLDLDGKLIFESSYDYISPAGYSDLFLVKQNEKLLVLDKEKVVQSIIDIDLKESKMINEGVLPVLEKEKWKYYDINTNQYILSEYDDVSAFCYGQAFVKSNDKWTLINKDGDELNNTVYEDVVLFPNGEFTFDDIMIAKIDGKYRILDSKGNPDNTFESSKMDYYLGGLIAYQSDNGKWGFVDSNGNIKIEAQYDEAKSFSNGLGAVKTADTWGFINETGKLVIESQFAEA